MPRTRPITTQLSTPDQIPEHSTLRRRRAVLPVLVGAVLLMAAACGGNDRSAELATDTTVEAEGVPLLHMELARQPGLDPFYEDLESPEDLTGLAEADLVETGGEVDGAEPGLYGGTRDASSCDVGQLAEFLDEQDTKAEAWAGALGLDADRAEEYLDLLTPMTLTVDTQVVNHGFADGRATPRDAVLEVGTAVLVDHRGVPRVRCACGNPLLEAEPLPADREVTLEGDPWPDFDLEATVTVEVAMADMTEFVLIDLATGDRFVRPTGTRGEADVPETGDDEPGRPAAEECGVAMRDHSQPDQPDALAGWEAPVWAGVGTTVSCSEALGIAEQWLDTDAEQATIGDWTCEHGSVFVEEGVPASTCSSSDGVIEIYELVDPTGGNGSGGPDDGLGGPGEPGAAPEAPGPDDGLGGPGFADCGTFTDSYGVAHRVDVSGGSDCPGAVNTVERFFAGHPGGAGWAAHDATVGDWSCTTISQQAWEEGIAARCDRGADMIQVVRR